MAETPPVGAPPPSASEDAFGRLLSLLPDDVKHLLLLEALETAGPSCLVGLESARDAILYAAVRHEPGLLRSVTGFLEHGDNVFEDDEVPADSDAQGDAAGDDMEDDADLLDTTAATGSHGGAGFGPPRRAAGSDPLVGPPGGPSDSGASSATGPGAASPHASQTAGGPPGAAPLSQWHEEDASGFGLA